MNLTEEVKAKAKELGADLVGIAPVDRFKGAPVRMSPRGLLSKAKSVIVVAVRYLDAAVELSGEPTPHDMGAGISQSTAMNPKLDDISFLLARFLEDKGIATLPITASNIWRYHGYKDLDLDFAPDIAHRYAAVAAGLGEIGWNGLFLTPQFGPRQRIVSIITEAELDPTPMYDGPPLCDRCMECVKNCPTDAFRKEVKKINKIEIGGKVFEFPDTNKWRCGWAENFCLNLAHTIPDTVNTRVISNYLEKYGPHEGELGFCTRFCMVPEKRYYDESYCRGPRRKKEKTQASPEDLLKEIKNILVEKNVELITIARKESFANDASLHPEYYLPNVQSLILIGITVPPGSQENMEVMCSLQRQLDYAEYEVGRYLDNSGYSAMIKTKLASNFVAGKLGVLASDAMFTTILTSAKLPSISGKKEEADGERITPEEIRTYSKKVGADLVGFFNVERFEQFRQAMARLTTFPEWAEVVEDQGFVYGSFIPEIRREEVRIKGPLNHLSKARSVIVLGLHFPDATLDTAKVTPAETTGPYSFVQYETLRLLADIALRLIKKLNKGGYRATLTSDLVGLASKTKSPRGMLPDMRANRFAALLAGLGYLGVNGSLLTKEFGIRQRFIAIVTDCPLPNDTLYSGEIVCSTCDKKCIEACPTAAIKKDMYWLKFDGKEFDVSKIDYFACDWAKRYCLSGQEGPKYAGMDVDVAVPEQKTSSAIVKALTNVKWGFQKRFPYLCEECIRLCPAKGEKRKQEK